MSLRVFMIWTRVCPHGSQRLGETTFWLGGIYGGISASQRWDFRAGRTESSPSQWFIRPRADFRHRIDSVTMYASPAAGPHGFYTLGKTVESTLRSFNNLLERLHASYFFYLIPQQDRFIPVGHYLPIAVLLGASITIGGFECPAPLQGLLWFLPAFALGFAGWMLQHPVIILSALALPQPKGDARKSLISLAYLFYGAIIPTLAMVNFPQAILLAFLCLNSFTGGILGSASGQVMLYMTMEELRLSWLGIGNLAWVGVFALLVPLWTVSAMIR